MAIASGAFVWSACGDDSDPPPSAADGGSSSAADGGSSTPSSPDAETATCDESEASLAAACKKLCDNVAAASCAMLEFHVPRVYDLYTIYDGKPTWATEDCPAACLEQKLGKGCSTETGKAIDCIAGGTCEDKDKFSSSGRTGQWRAPKSCAELGRDVYVCGKQCLGLTTCDPSTCNDRLSAGTVFCYWACEDDVCQQHCN